MRTLLRKLGVIQVRQEGVGNYSNTYYRANPFNPLSYIVILLTLMVGVILYGVVGMRKEIDRNPFKWK